MDTTVIRYSHRPELWADTASLSREVWPEYNTHGDVLNRYWSRLFDVVPDYQFALYDEQTRRVLAEGHTIPCSWDGTADGLGDGIDAVIAEAFESRDEDRPPNALCALAAEIRPQFQGAGLAHRVLDAMAEIASEQGARHLIAPVRPNWKARYPLIPIGQYATWTRQDGEPFDPWMRVHTRRGGVIVKPAPKSMRISGTVAEWEGWTGMRFHADGHYTFPAGLAPLQIDHSRDLGAYWEPNVWIVHAIRSSARRS